MFRLFKSRYNILKHASPAKPGKRFVSFCIDFVVVFLVSCLLFFVGNAIMISTQEYQTADENYVREVEYYNNFIKETHLAEENRDDYSAYRIAVKNVQRAIYLSYETFGNEQYSDFKLNDNVKQYGIGDRENDNLAYFYLNYVPAHPELNIVDFGEKTPSEFLINLYEEVYGDQFKILFSVTDYELPVLNTQAAYFMFHYLYNTDKDDMFQKGLEYYQTYEQGYTYMLEYAEKSVYTSEPYYTEHYLVYQNNAITKARCINITMLICIVIGSFIGVMIPKFLFKDETTIGRKLSGLGVITIDNEKLPKWIYVVKSIITSIFYFAVSLIIYAFFYGFRVLSFPIYPDVAISFGLIILILIIIAIINSSFSLFTHNKQTLLDIIFRSKVVDLKFLDEGDLDEPEEAMPY